MWEMVKLNTLCEINIGKTPSRNNPSYWGGSNKWIAIADLKGDKVISNTKECISDIALKEAKIKVIKKGTIIYSFKLSIGKIAITGEDMYSNEAIASFPITKSKSITTGYLYWVLQTLNLQEIGEKAVMGLTLNKKKLNEIKIPLPPLEIQQQIVSILDKADTLRRTDKALEEKYDALAQSIFIDMFGDPVKNEKGWEKRKVLDIVSKEKYSIKAGPFGSSLKKEFYVTNGYKIYGQEQVITDDLTTGDYYIDEERFNKLSSCAIREGDVLISLVGTYGKVSVVPEKFEKGIINPRLMKITLNRDIYEPFYFKFLMRLDSIKRDLSKHSRGGTMDIINVGILSDFSVIVPPIKLQNKFLEKLNLINQMKEQEMKGEELFQSLLQRAFKGELVS
ncbi:restriction endonuclease subunit S [Myroides odoratimimus]|uniref:restriction endonuclease subunit S n=1 Tax=Myroides odoratimimus TaxID=76832 RepID=UPI0025753B76|nr:restriction endonuclease subunit S [Myroides odoratimimus]MDM1065416.1 restriction endonuclease subunit S [Myroides odoratimimus]